MTRSRWPPASTPAALRSAATRTGLRAASGAVAVFAIYADGSVVRLINGQRGANLSGTASVRVRGGVYSVDANVEDGARWELACSRR